MATAETDLDRPNEVIMTIRPRCKIIHPSRTVFARKNKKSFLRKIFFMKRKIFYSTIYGGEIELDVTEKEAKAFENKTDSVILSFGRMPKYMLKEK